ncbi:cytochrome c oxidase subunit 5A, mitochondrial-like [Limulus polyphemus]|uniref:Cytochrome c oxidase subunit 5A, mitochondrial n=1 Tax=Limulus polyphemus TaxID=6850 RepID=A0ABM1BRM1_LIMPO|nr:cytochrome c oxidase subunit 5A, mitochondrial-like [Limulus polyphemus]XP_013787334.1 cytochrome c oxidase subunit 5A, mitochondrial-like [Limulus polyphemus]
MFRIAIQRGFSCVKNIQSVIIPYYAKIQPAAVTSVRSMSKHSTETDEEFDARYEAYFNRTDIDGWDVRKAMNDLQGMDLVPEPKIMIAALRACRRVNDYALAVRFLEAVKDKCGTRMKEIYPFLLQEVRPTLDELGICTPEEMGYDKPELHLENVYDIH